MAALPIRPDSMPSTLAPPPAPPALESLGQVFTPESVVRCMLRLRHNTGRVLEPSCGDGAFLTHLRHAVGIELDPRQCPAGALNIDFFAYPESEKFDTVIGNPPYVRYRDIGAATRKLLRQDGFDGRSNLYLFFIEKCVRHLAPGGELIFITPRDFLKATSARRLNRWLHERGTITHAIELGDARVFADALPNCLIWRYELGETGHHTAWARISQGDDLAHSLDHPQWQRRNFLESAGHLLFSHGEYGLSLADVASVKVGAVSGLDAVFASEAHGNRDFVTSATARTGQTRRMIWCEPDAPPPEALLPHLYVHYDREAVQHLGRATNDFYKALAQGTMVAAKKYGGEDYACVLGQEMAGGGGGQNRAGGQTDDCRIIGSMRVFFDGRDPEVNGEPFVLPRRERRILEYLVRNQNKRVTKEKIFGFVYGFCNEEVEESVIESHISKLRKKLRARLGFDPIDSKRYVGYMPENG